MKKIVDIGEVFRSSNLIFLGQVGINLDSDYEAYTSWIEENRHAGMKFMAANQDVRRSPQLILAGVQTIFSFACFYEESEGNLKNPESLKPAVASYALRKDYHRVLKNRGEEVVKRLAQSFPGEQFRVCVDSVPLFERGIARQSKAGFIGKNTMFIHPKEGSFCLLGEILSTLPPIEAESTPSCTDSCGACRRCEVHCPTGALDGHYHLDARRCLSYWTIEHRGAVPLEYWPWFRWFYFGCDLCQSVCPFNSKLGNQVKPGLPRGLFAELDLFRFSLMSQVEYEQWFGGTPMTRAKRSGLRRNALISATVWKHPRIREIVDLLLLDEDSLLRETAQSAKEWLTAPPPFALNEGESYNRFAKRWKKIIGERVPISAAWPSKFFQQAGNRAE